MILVLSIIFIILMVAVGADKGIQSCFSLLLNGGMMALYIFAVVKGWPFVPVTIVSAVLFVAITLFYQIGCNIKTYVAAFASIIVVLLLAAFINLFVSYSHVEGFHEVDLSMDISTELSDNVDLDMEEVEVAVIILGMLGAIMDTSVAISTAVFEVYANNKKLTRRELMEAGNNVARDILGTTVNTLCFAGMGEAFIMCVLLYKYNYGFARLINSETVFQLFMLVFIASIGCIIIIPVTTLCMCVVLKSRNVWMRVAKRRA